MGSRVLIFLIGTKKGAFILESDAERGAWELRGPFCETWPMNHVAADPATGTIYGGGGNEWFGPAVWKSTDLGRDMDAFEPGSRLSRRARSRSRRSGAWRRARRRLYAGVEPAGLFRSDDGGQSWRHVAGLRDHPRGRDWQPGGVGLILHSLVPHPTTACSSGSASPRPACSTPRTAARPGSRAIGHALRLSARGTALSGIRPVRALPGAWRPACPTASTSRTIAACTAARTAAGAGTASRPACRRALAFLLRPIPATRRRCSSCRSTATCRAAIRQTRRRRSGARAMAAPAGRRCARACRRDAFFGVLRQAMATDALDPAGVYFGTNTGALSPAPTRATAGAPSPSTCPRSARSKPWSSTEIRRRLIG